MSENHLHAWLFSDPCGQVLKKIKSRVQICLILLRRKGTFPSGLENNHACKWIVSVFLENCQKSICMHGCPLIYVERSLSLLEFHGVRICECNICISLIKNDNTPILHTCLTLCWSCLCSTANHLVVPLWFWVFKFKKKN